jgi:hypothetical protein
MKEIFERPQAKQQPPSGSLVADVVIETFRTDETIRTLHSLAPGCQLNRDYKSTHCNCWMRFLQTSSKFHTLQWPPLWSSGQSSWPQMQRSGFNSRRYQIFWEVVGLERGPLSLVSTTEELLGRTSSGSGLENRDYGRRDPQRWPRNTNYSQKLAPISPTSGGHLENVGPLTSHNPVGLHGLLREQLLLWRQ